MVTKEGKTCSNDVKPEATKQGNASVCPICGKPATQLVDGEPSCADHIEQVYEHQVEEYTRAHLKNNEWCKA
jgi:uncharacterized Zn finger protein (UPF0148 family)